MSRIFRDIKRIIRLSEKAYIRAKDEDYAHVEDLIASIKDLSQDESFCLKKENIPAINKQILAQVQEISNDCDRILDELRYPEEKSHDRIIEWIRNIVSLSRYEFGHEKSREGLISAIHRKRLYNGTSLGVVFSSLYRLDGLFGMPDARFFLDKKAAMHYAKANPRLSAMSALRNVGIDIETLGSPMRKTLCEPIVLEFDTSKVDVRFEDIEFDTAQPEFSYGRPVPLSSLTSDSKEEIVKRLRLVDGSREYRLLYS